MADAPQSSVTVDKWSSLPQVLSPEKADEALHIGS